MSNTKQAEKIFKPPFRLGRNQDRAILDSDGIQVIVFPKGQEKMAADYCSFLNTKNPKQDETVGEKLF